MKELITQKEYVDFIKNINTKYYYPIQDTKSSLDFEHLSLYDSINNKSCFYKHLLIGEKQISLLCINHLYNSLSLYDLSSRNEINNTKVFQIPLSLNLNYSKSVKVSFSAFDEEETKIFIFNDDKIYSLHLRLNYSLDNFKLSYINNFTIANYTNESQNLIYISTTLYHGNRYIIYGYKTGECKIYFLRDKFNDSYISPRTIFSMKHEIYKIYQIQGYLFIIDENRKKIRILSLLGSNSILVNCYSFNDIIDIAFDYKNNLLYILDNKGNIIIKELTLSVSKAYTNTCNSIYSLQIPNYILQNNNHSKKTLKLVMLKNSNIIYIIGKNYLGYINDKFELENYIIYNELIYNDDFIFSKGSTSYLITNYKNEIIIYKTNQIKKEKKTTEKPRDKKEKIVYNIIDDNSGVVDCNGNLICKLLFNSFTNNKYVINTLYLTCLIIIISTVYYFKQNSKTKNYKTFKEDDLDNNEKGNKFSKMFEKMKNIKNFEMFSDYKKRQRNNNINNVHEEEYKDKDYYGDEDDNDINDVNEKENEDEFLEQAYRNYVKGMMKKKIGDDEEIEEEDEDEEEEIDNYVDNNEGNNRNNFEERKGHSSNED